jgi:hypothetical protein
LNVGAHVCHSQSVKLPLLSLFLLVFISLLFIINTSL